MSWELVAARTLTEPLIRSLIDNEVGAVCIDGYVAQERCARFVESIARRSFTELNGVPKIGLSRTEFWHLPDGEARYLSEVPRAEAQRREILGPAGDLLPEVLALLRSAWPGGARVLTCDTGADNSGDKGGDKGGAPYFAGILRSLRGNLLHIDWDPTDVPHWTSGKVVAQLSWNIYFQTSEEGGEVTLYRKLWHEADNAHKRTDTSYGYQDSVVAGCERLLIRPRSGQLIFFNTRNFHRVEPVQGQSPRLTMSSACGLQPQNNHLVLWS